MASIAKALDETGVFVWRNLAHIPRVPEKLADVTIQPIMFVVLFGYVFGSAIAIPGGGNYREFLMGGIFIQSLTFAAMSSAMGVVSDMKEGVIDRFRSLPITRLSVLLGRAIASLIESALGITIMAICGLIVGWGIHNGFGNAVAGFALLGAYAFAMICIGAAIGLLVRTTEAAQGIGFVIIFPLTFASNAFVPTQGMPAILRFIADWGPVSPAVAAVRHLFGNPNPIPEDAGWMLQHPIAGALIWCVILSVLGLSVAVWRYSKGGRR